MNEQNNIPRLQMNRELKSVTADITLEPDARREAYRLSNRLAQKTIESENKRRLADALGYTDVAPMLAGIEALTDMVIPVQRAFGDNKVTCIKREDEDADTSPQSNSAWLEQARARWRRFELTATDIGQVGELNRIIKGHGLTRRDLAVITASLRLRPEFTLDDFSPNLDESNQLSGFATEQLAAELERRDEVETLRLHPYAVATMKMEGPLLVLKVLA